MTEEDQADPVAPASADRHAALFRMQDLHEWFSHKEYGVGGRPCKDLIPKIQVRKASLTILP